MANVNRNGQGGYNDMDQLVSATERGQVNGAFDQSRPSQTQSQQRTEPRSASQATLRTVRVKVVFQKIGDIDTLKETFIADVLLEARWREPKFDGDPNATEGEKINWKKFWNPKLSIVNFLGEHKEPLSYSLEYWKNEAEVVELRRFNGTFSEKLELGQFPFDQQELQVTVASALSNNEVVLEDYDCHLLKENPQSFADEQEWKLHDAIDVRISHENQKLPSLSAYCLVSRRFGFYLWNFMFVMFMISASSLVTWAIAVTKPENRIQVTFVLLLTTITFKFAVASSLPRISYLTYLDKYILTMMVFMVFVAIWHGLALPVHIGTMGEQPKDIYFSWSDKVVLIIMSAVFVAINLAFFIVIYRARRIQRKASMKTQAELLSFKDNNIKLYGSVNAK